MTPSPPEARIERILVAFTLPHRGHDGIPGAPDNSCMRCNAERDLDAVVVGLRELQEALRDVTAYSILQHSGKYAVDADVMEKLFALAASSEEPG